MSPSKETIASNVQHIRQVALIEFGQPFEELSIREKAEVIAIAAREEVLVRQAATQKTYQKEKPKKAVLSIFGIPPRRLDFNERNKCSST